MYGLNNLKEKISITEHSVECPIKGCKTKVLRQRKVFKKTNEFICPSHKICISPSTFEYEKEEDNLLWFEPRDQSLFNEIKAVKRESRIARDNSEDAVSWNVFRYLDREGLLDKFLTHLSNKQIKGAELILWSYSPAEKKIWSKLNNARIEFGETIAKSSEPDIIILTDKVLYFFEAKLNAGNKTKPSNFNNRKKYETGGDNHFEKVFTNSYEKVAIKEQRYELMRFWLLGTWIAKELELDFEFYSLLRAAREINLEKEFSNLIKQTHKNTYSRISWEDIYDYIESKPKSKSKDKMCEYFKNKAIGYSSGKIQKGFKIK
jgi:hypothetical protein